MPSRTKAAKRRKRPPRRRSRHWLLTVPYLVGALVGGLLTWLVTSSGNGPNATLAKRPDPVNSKPQEYAWTDQPEPAFPIPPYARFLSAVNIVLDPGHVGQRDPGGNWKRGPTGLREAEVNLRVAQFLREFLEAAGARVTLTREVDRCLGLSDEEDLRARAELANRIRADLLLSIHHNGDSDPQPNFTTVFYHGTPDHSPASLAAGRHLVVGLNDALRLETHLQCALLSDYAIYPGKGLAILRLAEVPAVLTEASFHSNPAEEDRLRDPVYNRREAYGLFLGLARWAQAGLPRVSLLSTGQPIRPGGQVLVGLEDGLSERGGWDAEQAKILPGSIVVKLDGQPARFRLDLAKRQLRVTLPGGLREGPTTLWVDFENVFGQHVLHPRLELEVGR